MDTIDTIDTIEYIKKFTNIKLIKNKNCCVDKCNNKCDIITVYLNHYYRFIF